jgi:hypothetical protein
MKSKLTACFFAGILLGALVIACGSTPPAVEDPPPAPTQTAPPAQRPESPTPDPNAGQPDEAAMNALQEARERVGKARQRANDFNGSLYFSQEWDQADDIITRLEEDRELTGMAQVREAISAYNRAAGAFDKIFDDSIPLFAKERENELNSFRAAAVDEGARELLPEYFLTADKTAVLALDKYKNKDYYGAREGILEAVELYRALITGSQALKVRREILERNFIDTDPESFELADLAARTAADAFMDMNTRDAQDGAEEAYIRYDMILKTALEEYASRYREDADLQRQQAIRSKANVAVRQEFDLASSVYSLAEAAFREENFDEAVKFYIQVSSMYKVLEETAGEKRQIAEDALRNAELKMVESDGRARHAELVLEGGTQ